MRSLRRILILTAVLTALLLPAVTFADDSPLEPPYYTSTTGEPDGLGTGDDPRLATETGPNSLEVACNHFGLELEAAGLSEGTLYWVIDTASGYSYVEYELEPTDGGGICTAVRAASGTPPGFGVTLTPPVVVGGLVALGVVLLTAAWLLSRRLRTATRPA
jgi:hypothetical protein